MDKTKESLSIRLLDSHSNPLKNQEFRLFEVQNGRRSIINTIFTSNENGEAFFNAKEVFKEGTQSFEIGLHNTLCYKRKPIYNHRYLLRNYEYGYLCEVKFAKKADDASIEKVTLKPKEYLLDNNEKIILKFYAGGDIVELEAFYDVTKIQEDEIKWGYTLLTASSQEHSKNLDTLNKNQLTNDKKDSSLFDDKISTTCCHIEKRGDIAILSGTPIDMMQDNPQAYRGKTIQIALPKTTNQQAILIFAYKNIPNYRASQLIRLNDYPQITIDCTLAETLRAYTRQDNIATLGWGVSYVLQRLWHDNPSDAKELSKLIYIDSHSPDFIESIPNVTMQSIVKEVLPRITLKEFSKDSNNKYPAIKSQIQEIKDNNLRFYVELDWEEFYLKFNVMQRLSRRFFHIIAAVPDIHDTGIYTMQDYEKAKQQAIEQERLLNLNSHITKNFLESIQELVSYHQYQIKKDFEGLNAKEGIFTLAVNAKAIAKGIIANKEIYTLIPKIQSRSCVSSYQNYENLARIYPYNIDRAAMQTKLGLDDMDFGMEFISDMENKQAIALYACTGKFSVYYVPATFLLKKENGKISIYIKELYAYVYDVFDFDDEGHSYEKGKEHKDENIKTLGQPVGTWDYNTLRFDFGNSIRQVAKYSEDEKISFWNMLFVKTANALVKWQTALEIYEIPTLKQQQIYPLYNQDYQDYKQRFNKGLNFRVFSKDKTIKDKFHKGFYIVKVPSDEASMAYFRVEI